MSNCVPSMILEKYGKFLKLTRFRYFNDLYIAESSNLAFCTEYKFNVCQKYIFCLHLNERSFKNPIDNGTEFLTKPFFISVMLS